MAGGRTPASGSPAPSDPPPPALWVWAWCPGRHPWAWVNGVRGAARKLGVAARLCGLVLWQHASVGSCRGSTPPRAAARSSQVLRNIVFAGENPWPCALAAALCGPDAASGLPSEGHWERRGVSVSLQMRSGLGWGGGPSLHPVTEPWRRTRRPEEPSTRTPALGRPAGAL